MEFYPFIFPGSGWLSRVAFFVFGWWWIILIASVFFGPIVHSFGYGFYAHKNVRIDCGFVNWFIWGWLCVSNLGLNIFAYEKPTSLGSCCDGLFFWIGYISLGWGFLIWTLLSNHNVGSRSFPGFCFKNTPIWVCYVWAVTLVWGLLFFWLVLVQIRPLCRPLFGLFYIALLLWAPVLYILCQAQLVPFAAAPS